MAITDQEIAELAESIADSVCPELPVDPERIALDEGITWTYGGYEDAFDGLLAHSDGDFHIFCNAARGSHRRSRRGRFTFGHELGHYFIDDHRVALASGAMKPHLSQGEWKSDAAVERQADHFAANLLMPHRRFIESVKRQPVGMSAVLHTREAFHVSMTSASVRYLDACPVACAIALWDSDGNYRWAWPSKKARELRLYKTINELDGASADFATARAISGEEPEGDYFENVTTAHTWFPLVPEKATNNVFMTEQAIRLGDFGTLTILTARDPI